MMASWDGAPAPPAAAAMFASTDAMFVISGEASIVASFRARAIVGFSMPERRSSANSNAKRTVQQDWF